MTGPRYEPRPLPGQGRTYELWGAWDTARSDWVRYPGTGVLAGHAQVFTSELRVEEWVRRQDASLVAEETPGRDAERICD